MAWTYSQVRDFAVNQDEIGRVQVAIVQAAIVVGNEPGNQANKANRNNFMNDVLRSPDYWAERMIWGIAVDSTVQDAPNDDAVLQAAALNVWDQYSGLE